MTTDKYDLHTIDYSVQGWDAIMTTDMEKLDAVITSRILATVGETVDAYEAVYIKSDGKVWLAQADGTAMPAIGLMIESGVADETKRVQRSGVITNVAWSWSNVGGYVYLDPTTPGALTETLPSAYAQIIGTVLSTTSIFFNAINVSNRPYEIGGTFNGVPTASATLLRIPFPRTAIFPADLSESTMYAEITATASTVITLYKNGVSFATATFLPDTNPDAAAAVNKGGGLVGIPITGHGFSDGQIVVLSGTSNYDGTYAIDSTSSTNEIVIDATYAAETFTGSEDVLMNWAFFVCASEVSFSALDIFTITCPVTPDVTLANIGWMIVGSRSSI
jgi:hypothetical protein